MSKNKVNYSRWIKRGTSTFIPTDNSEILDEVEAGVYDLRVADGIGFYMFKRDLFLDEILEFPSSIHTQVLNSIKEFWNRRDKFKEYGFAFKRGILLHGRAGSGKSCTISLCMKYAIDEIKGVEATVIINKAEEYIIQCLTKYARIELEVTNQGNKGAYYCSSMADWVPKVDKNGYVNRNKIILK